MFKVKSPFLFAAAHTSRHLFRAAFCLGRRRLMRIE